jgi:hypothetical protein
MPIKALLSDGLGRLLGASWANPLRTALFGRGGGDYHSPISFTATATGINQVVLASVGPTITDASQFRSVRAVSQSGELIGEWYPCAQNRFTWNSNNSTLTISNANFGAVGYVDVELHAEHRAYSSSEDAYQQYAVNPDWTRTAQTTPVDLDDVTDDTYYYYLDWDGYKYGGLQIELGCDAGTVTATLEATRQDDGTAQASCSYLDRTLELTGAANLQAAAGTASDDWAFDTPISYKYMRAKIVAATGGNTGDITIYDRRIY